MFSLIFFIFLPIGTLASTTAESNSYMLADREYTSPDQLPSDSFIPITNNSIGESFSDSDLWLKIPLNESHIGKGILLTCTFFEDVSVYLPQVGGGYEAQSYSWDTAKNCSVENLLYPYFELSDSISYSDTAYVRVSSIYSLNFSVSILSFAEYHCFETNTLMIFGLIFGILLAMVAYNLMISSFIADKSYRYYILYIASIGIYQLAFSGIASMLPLGILRHINHYMLPLAMLTLLSALLFTVSYLQLKSYSLKLFNIITKILMPLSVVIMICSIFLTTRFMNIVIHCLAGVSLPVIFFAGALAQKRGNVAAKPFLVAWSFLILGAAVFIGRSAGFVPNNIITSNSLVISAAIEAVLLAVALAQNIRRIYQEREVLTQSHESLTELSTHDDLTGLFNKRYFRQVLAEITEKIDSETDLTIGVLDIDHFKNYNDTYGHLQGDTVLRVVGELFYDSIDECDIPCRYGGEEFVFVMPDCDIDKAQTKMDEMRERIAELHFVTSQGETTQVTASIGITKYKIGEDTSQFFIRADKALYRAKEGGRNRVEVG